MWNQQKDTGLGCIKQLKIKWEFLQPFPVFQRIFWQAIMDKSTEGRLKSIGNTMTVRKNLFQNTGNGCRNCHVILSCFMQPGPGTKAFIHASFFAVIFVGSWYLSEIFLFFKFCIFCANTGMLEKIRCWYNGNLHKAVITIGCGHIYDVTKV